MKKTKVKRKIRKPRELKLGTILYPRIENDEKGRIWVQAVPTGKWKKVPLERAKALLCRFDRAIRYSQESRA